MFQQKFNSSIIGEVLKAAVEHNRKILIDQFTQMGEYFLTITDQTRGYNNDTHNLSASKGFMVFDNGNKITEGGFSSDAPTVTTGPTKGREVAAKEAPKKGIALIIVAGERYAASVESKGYNVLTSEGFQLEKEVRKLVNQLK